MLVDLMKKDSNLGAACGRIHPVGSGKSTYTVGLHSNIVGIVNRLLAISGINGLTLRAKLESVQ
jgi:hypothetical protein